MGGWGDPWGMGSIASLMGLIAGPTMRTRCNETPLSPNLWPTCLVTQNIFVCAHVLP